MLRPIIGSRPALMPGFPAQMQDRGRMYEMSRAWPLLPCNDPQKHGCGHAGIAGTLFAILSADNNSAGKPIWQSKAVTA
jgi:hypothetical protein